MLSHIGMMMLATPAAGVGETAKATFAGGCFWCMEYPFDKIDGVISTRSGYIGGHKDNPTYEEVCSGETGHTEAIEVVYDPNKVNYEQLLQIFWRNIDPLAKNRQFCDIGSQYRTAIFCHDAAQKKAAEDSLEELNRSGRFEQPIVTEIVAATTFYPAEEYHQKYYKKSPIRYQVYRSGSGRDGRLRELWDDEADE
jgi:peptide-methionine (S)-S-oxide reductase